MTIRAIQSATFLIVIVIVGLFIFAASTVKSGNESWSGWAQFFGSILAVGAAILVPYIQREIERRDDRAIRDITAAAFALTLLPKMKRFLDELSAEVRDIDEALENPNAEGYSTLAGYYDEMTFLEANWRELDNFVPRVARPLIAAVAAIRAAGNLVDHENFWSQEYPDGRVYLEVPLVNRSAFVEYRDHHEHARQLLANLMPLLEALIRDTDTQSRSSI